MAKNQCIDFFSPLSTLFTPEMLENLARESGWVRRVRKLDVVAFFWTLVLGFGSGKKRTIAGLRRCYETKSGLSVVPSAFYDRFTPRLVTFFKLVLGAVLPVIAEPFRPLRGRLEHFTDLVTADATVLRLHGMMEKLYPAARSTMKAAGKLHVVMSVTGVGPRTVQFFGERRPEVKALRIGPWVRGRLVLLDLAYYSYNLFARIARNRGYFITRVKSRANPKVLRLLQPVRGRSVPVEGLPLQEVLPKLKRQVLDAMVEVEFKHRPYAGKRNRARTRFRLVALRNGDNGKYHLYLTNVPLEWLDAEDIGRLYAARWEVELVFRQLKQRFHLAELPSGKPHIVEALVYSSLVSLVASRVFWCQLKRTFPGQADRITAERWSAIFEASTLLLLETLLEGRQEAELPRRILLMWMQEMFDPNLKRRGGLIPTVEAG